MPSIERRERFQKAVLWEKTDGFDDYGRPRVSSPVQIHVRWKYVRKQSVNKEGVPIAVDATVVVDRYIPEGSILWLGELIDWVGTGSNDNENQLMEVLTFHNTPDIRNRHTRRTVDLAFYKSVLPDLS